MRNLRIQTISSEKPTIAGLRGVSSRKCAHTLDQPVLPSFSFCSSPSSTCDPVLFGLSSHHA